MSRHTYAPNGREQRRRRPPASSTRCKLMRAQRRLGRACRRSGSPPSRATCRCGSWCVEKDGTRYEHVATRHFASREDHARAAGARRAPRSPAAALRRARRPDAVALLSASTAASGQSERALRRRSGVRRAAAQALARGGGRLGRSRRRWSPRRCCACSDCRRARSRAWSTRLCRAHARGAHRRRCRPRCAPTCRTGCGSASRDAARRGGGAAHRAGPAEPGAARLARQPRADRAATRRTRASRADGIDGDADAVFARGAAARGQAGDQPPPAVRATAWSKCRTRAASCSPGCSRRGAAR